MIQICKETFLCSADVLIFNYLKLWLNQIIIDFCSSSTKLFSVLKWDEMFVCSLVSVHMNDLL